MKMKKVKLVAECLMIGGIIISVIRLIIGW
ncbi:membrane protein [Bacillus phage Nachito]|nr:membrane protein [Bacillus phage Nachito]